MGCEVDVMVKKHYVGLTGEEQGELKGLVSKAGLRPISRLMRASCCSATRTKLGEP